MKRLIVSAVLCFIALHSHAQSICYQDASSAPDPNNLPTAEDRAVFDQVLVSYVAKSVSTSNDATALADSLLWMRSQKFYPQPRELATGLPGYGGTFQGPKWTEEEQALWLKLVASSLQQAMPYHSPDPKLASYAFYAAWDAMAHRRMYVTYDCTGSGQ